MSQEQIQLVAKTQRLLHGPLKHVRAAALAAALLPLASVAVSPASAQSVDCARPDMRFRLDDTNNNAFRMRRAGIVGAGRNRSNGVTGEQPRMTTAGSLLLFSDPGHTVQSNTRPELRRASNVGCARWKRRPGRIGNSVAQ